MLKSYKRRKYQLSRYYPWDKKSKLGRDFRTRKEFMGFEVSRSGLIFDKNGNYKKPSFRYSKNGAVTVRRFRFYKDGKQVEFGYDRFVYAAWHQDTFDIYDRDVIVYRDSPTNSGHVEDLKTCTRGEHLYREADKLRLIPKEEYPHIIDTWNQVKDVMEIRDLEDHLGVPRGTVRRIINGAQDSI